MFTCMADLLDAKGQPIADPAAYLATVHDRLARAAESESSLTKRIAELEAGAAKLAGSLDAAVKDAKASREKATERLRAIALDTACAGLSPELRAIVEPGLRDAVVVTDDLTIDTSQLMPRVEVLRAAYVGAPAGQQATGPTTPAATPKGQQAPGPGVAAPQSRSTGAATGAATQPDDWQTGLHHDLVEATRNIQAQRLGGQG